MIRAIEGFDWDDGNREKCCRHGLSAREIEHVVGNQETLIVPDAKHSVAEPRFLAIGRTDKGRYAFVVFTPRMRDGKTFVRPISARFMHSKEIKTYEEEISRSQK